MVLPMKFTQSIYDDTHWANFFLNTFVVMKPGVNVAQAELKMNSVYATEAAEQIKKDEANYGPQDKVVYHLQPMSDIHLNTEYNGGNGLKEGSNPMYSYILCGIAIFILIIACINFVNLTVARSLKRAKEIGIRKVVGSHKKQLVIQFMGESFILSFLSFSLAIALTSLSLPFFNSLAEKALSFSYLLDTKLIAGYILLFLVTGFLAGFYPALVLSGFNPVETLYGRFRFTGKNYLSKGLIVFQFTLATFLIIATVTIYSQFTFLINYDLGINTDNVIRTKTPPIDAAHFEIFKRELKKDPSILLVTGEQGGTWGTMAHINGDKNIDFNYRLVDENFLSLFQIPIAFGRSFIKESSDTIESVMVNETFVKTAGWRNPIGETVDFFYNKQKFKVIGVVKDYHFAALTETIKPQLFTISKRHKYGTIFIKVAEGSKGRAIHHIEKTYKTLYTMQPTNYVWLKEDRDSQYNREAKWKQIITFSTFLTVFISCIGLFGLAALSAEKRAKEIGIRKVLGASVTTIVQKLSTDFLKLVLLAGIIASPLAWWVMNKWLQDYPYRIEMKTTIFGLAIVTVVLVSLITVLFQSLKAAVANPVKSLRTE
jgi:putative ABC transport system permease protein